MILNYSVRKTVTETGPMCVGFSHGTRGNMAPSVERNGLYTCNTENKPPD